MTNTQVWLAMVTWLLFGLVGRTSEPNLRVDLDVTEVPEHAAWVRHAKQSIEEWTPRIHNLLLCHAAEPDRELRCFPSKVQCRRWDLNPHALAGNGF
ncbi:MAG: hypothetical protein RLZZ440_1976 [Planctomycetota bacterium]